MNLVYKYRMQDIFVSGSSFVLLVLFVFVFSRDPSLLGLIPIALISFTLLLTFHSWFLSGKLVVLDEQLEQLEKDEVYE